MHNLKWNGGKTISVRYAQTLVVSDSHNINFWVDT